jgi:ketosteroid isomerase-like protein
MAVTSTRSENLALARQLFDHIAAGNVDAMRALLHPDVHAAPTIGGASSLDGPAAVMDWWATLTGNGAEFEARPLDWEVQGSCVIVRGYMRHRENRILSERMTFWLCEIRDGQIVRMESHPSREAAVASIRPGDR